MFTLIIFSLMVWQINGAIDFPTCEGSQESEIRDCLEPMIDYAKKVQSQTLFPFQGVEVFENLCKSYQSFKTCISPHKCRSVAARALESSYGFVCDEAYPEFAKNAECFVEVENLDTYKVCRDDANDAINKISLDDVESSRYFETVCSLIKKYLKCSKPIISETCGDHGWKLIEKVSMNTLKNLPVEHCQNPEL